MSSALRGPGTVLNPRLSLLWCVTVDMLDEAVTQVDDIKVKGKKNPQQPYRAALERKNHTDKLQTLAGIFPARNDVCFGVAACGGQPRFGRFGHRVPRACPVQGAVPGLELLP